MLTLSEEVELALRGDEAGEEELCEGEGEPDDEIR